MKVRSEAHSGENFFIRRDAKGSDHLKSSSLAGLPLGLGGGPGPMAAVVDTMQYATATAAQVLIFILAVAGGVSRGTVLGIGNE